MINRIKGDLLKLAEEGEFDIIVHGCNCFTTMGSGIARQIREQYPDAFRADYVTQRGDIMKLGTFTSAKVGDLLIVNAYTQYTFQSGEEFNDLFEYASFEVILKKLAHAYPDQRYGFPLIGQGLAGGDPTLINGLIEKFSNEIDGTVTVVEYDPTA